MAEQLHTVTELGRMIAMLLACFAVGSLLVASLGQYAIAMFNMRRRTRDFGIRLSLGASTSLIQRSVLCEALELTAIGLLIGFVLSVGAAMALKSVLFGVTPADLPTYAAVGVILAITSVAASFLPAWRAGRVSVVEALRQE